MSKHKKRYRENEGSITPVSDNIAQCSYCGKRGNHTENDYSLGYKIPEFMVEPRELSGNTDNMVIICLECYLKKLRENKVKFAEWFRTHKTFPSITQTRENEAKFYVKAVPALFQAQRFMSRYNVWPNQHKKCSRCLKHDGQVTLESGLPNVKYGVTVVSKVRGRQRSVAAVMENLLCLDCADILWDKEKIFDLERTLEFLDRYERQIHPDIPDPGVAEWTELKLVKPAPPPTALRFEPKAQRKGGQWKKPATKATGTHG